MEAFGFNAKLCVWIKLILSSANLSFAVNGKPVGYFSCKRGVRQGDPLSPLLFCLADDVLSQGIDQLVNSGRLMPITGANGLRSPSHVLYADDVMVFYKGSKRNLEALMHLLHLYSQASGQHLSLTKCCFYAGNISPSRSASIASVLGFAAGHLPFTYLGVPIFKGKPRKIHLQSTADKIVAKLAAWKGSLLSIMGRVELVRLVIQGMLLHSFHAYAWPASLLKHIDKCIRNFI